jgi:hypothetical protein
MRIKSSIKPTEYEVNQKYTEFSNRFSEISPIPSTDKKSKTDNIKVTHDIMPVKELCFDIDKQRKKNIAKNFHNLEKFDKNSILFANNYGSASASQHEHERESLFDFNASGSSIDHADDFIVKTQETDLFYNETLVEKVSINASSDLDHFEYVNDNKREIIEMDNLEADLSQNVSSINSLEQKNHNNKYEIKEILNEINAQSVEVKQLQNRSCEISLKTSLETLTWFDRNEEHANKEKELINPNGNNLEDRISHNIMILENAG